MKLLRYRITPNFCELIHLINVSYTMLTWIQRLNPLFVVIRKLDISDVTFVPRIHDGFPHAGMFQAQTVSKLVNRHPVQVDAVARSCCKSFVVVKVCVTS